MSDGGRRTGNGKAPERSNFVQTCNLLSQFIKGKATIRDLNLGIAGLSEVAGKTDTATMDLLTVMEKPSIDLTKGQEQKSIDPVTTVSSRETEVVVNETSTSKEAPKEPKAAQLTMFYDGKVIVFDDFPADKARAVMLLASKGCPQSSFGTFQTTNMDKINTSAAAAAASASASASLTSSKTDPVAPQQQQLQIKPSSSPAAPQQQQNQHQQPLHVSSSTKTDQLKAGSISSAPPQKRLEQLKPIQSQGAGTSSSSGEQITSSILFHITLFGWTRNIRKVDRRRDVWDLHLVLKHLVLKHVVLNSHDVQVYVKRVFFLNGLKKKIYLLQEDLHYIGFLRRGKIGQLLERHTKLYATIHYHRLQIIMANHPPKFAKISLISISSYSQNAIP